MGKVILKDCAITVDAVDLSDHASEVSIETEFDEQETTGFGSVYKEYGQGLGDATITVSFFQDFDAASVDATLWPLSQSGEPFPLEIKPASGAVSATNPAYRLPAAALYSYSPLSGSVGEASSTEVTFRNSGVEGLVRDVVAV